jgi:hypothetical protein
MWSGEGLLICKKFRGWRCPAKGVNDIASLRRFLCCVVERVVQVAGNSKAPQQQKPRDKLHTYVRLMTKVLNVQLSDGEVTLLGPDTNM